MSDDAAVRRALITMAHEPIVDLPRWVALREQIEREGRVAFVPLLRDLRSRHASLAADADALILRLKRSPLVPAAEPEVPTWLEVAGGRLGVGHRPRVRSLPVLAAAGVTDVLTLLTPAEGAAEVARAVHVAGLRWHNLPLPNGRPPPDARDLEIRRTLVVMRARLQEGATLFVHCSAGIHRTGMVTAALLGFCGWDERRVVAGLQQMRAMTSDGVGEGRLSWAAAFVRRYAGES